MRRKTWIRIVAIVACCGVFALSVLSVLPSASAASTLSQLKSKQEQLKEEEEQIASALSAAKKDVKNQEAYQTQLKYKISNAQSQISNLSARIAALDGQISEKAASIEAMEAKIAENKDLFFKRVRAMYTADDATILSVLFGSSTFAEFLSASETTGRIAEHDDQLIKEMAEQKRQIEEEKAAVVANKQQIEADRSALQSQQNELNQAISESSDKLDELKALEQKTKLDYAEIVRQRKAADAEMEAFIREQQRKSQQGTLSPGGWLWPVGGYTRVTDTFGWRILNGEQNLHKGIDIPCAYGTPVRAAKSGTVIRANWSSSYGNVVVIDHGGGYCTLYAHNSSLAVTDQQTVTQGQTIAYAGDTGMSYGVHCHFEVWVGGVAQNPFGFVAATG